MLTAIAYYAKRAHDLPINPRVASDSPGYLILTDFRPPGYFVFLSLHRAIFGSLDYVAHAHLAIMFVGVAALALAVSTAARNILPAFAILFLAFKFSPWEDLGAIMSEPLFTALAAAGAGAAILYAVKPRLHLLIMASALFGLAASVRTTGDVLLAALGVALGLMWVTKRLSLRSILAAAAPAAAIMLAASAAIYANFGHFGLAPLGGLSILGKALMVAERLPPDNAESALNWVADDVRPAHETFRRIDDPVLRSLVARQYYEYLRWQLVLPDFDRRRPGWAKISVAEQAKAYGTLSHAYIRARPGAYWELVLLDYAGLWALPHLVTSAEHAALERRWESLGKVAFLREAEQAPGDYRKVVGRGRSFLKVWVVRLGNALFLLVSAMVGALLMTRRQARLAPVAGPILLLCSIVHGTYIATALNEAPLERYAAPYWPLILATLALTPTFLRQALAPRP